MDPSLIERSASYHGNQLLDLIRARDSKIPSAFFERTISNSSSADERDSSLSKSFIRSKLMNFIANKSDSLFADKFYGDFKKNLADQFRQSAGERSSGQQPDDDSGDEVWTQAEVDASDFASRALKSQSSQQTKDNASNGDAAATDPSKFKNIQSKYFESEMPPIETFMDIPSRYRKEHLFTFIEPGDIVIGSVDHVSDRGLQMLMICFDNQKKRDLERVKFNLFCPIKNVLNSAKSLGLKLNTAAPTATTSPSTAPAPQSSVKSQLASLFQPNDLVKCIVTSSSQTSDTCEVSLFSSNKAIKLGLITSEELPAYYQSIEYYEKDPCSFQRELLRSELFNNPAGVRILCKKFGLSTLPKYSLMKSLNNLEVAEADMADNLYKKQNFNLALKSVQRGITLLKENKSQDAILSFNKALQIDEKNVEAFVARGALYANQGDYARAIKDLEQALTIDSIHSNAKTYLKEVFVANAVKLEKQESYQESIKFLKKSLELDPSNEQVINRLADVKSKLLESYSKSQFGPVFPRSNSTSTSTSHSHSERRTGPSSSSSSSKKKNKKSKSRHRSTSRHSSSSSSSRSSNSPSHSGTRKPTTTRNNHHQHHTSKQSSPAAAYRQSTSISSDSRPSAGSMDHQHKLPRRTSLPSGENNSYTDQKRPRYEPEPAKNKSSSDEEDMEAFYLRLKTKQNPAPNSASKKK